MAHKGEMEQLVDEIARRVQARMGAAQPAPAAKESAPSKRRRFDDDPLPRARHKSEPSATPAAPAATAMDLAPLIDHTLLKPEASRAELAKLCDEARRYGFATVCVNSSNVEFCAAELRGSSVKPIAVVGFPLGAATPSAKAFEAREAVQSGAGEIDMVVNVGALRNKDYRVVLDDIEAVVRAVAPVPVKVILETGLLDHDQKVSVCVLAKVAGAAFVKTSTGFGPGGATVEDIALMRAIVGPEMGVKASGGVRTEADARKMIAAGATRLGASSSVAIVMGDKTSDKAAGAKKSSRGGY